MGKKQTNRRKRKSEAISSTSSSSGKSDTPQTPIKSITATPSDPKILRCSPRPRRGSSSSNNNNNNIEAEAEAEAKAEAEDGVVLVDGHQEREAAAAAAAADPKSKKKDKKRKMQQTASAAAEKSRQQEQEEEEAAAAAAAADHPKLTKKKDEKWKMQQPASSAAAASKSSCFTASIWSVEDEIKVLQGIMDHAKRNNGLPLHYNKKNAETFLAAIAPSLGIQPSVHQLERKIRYMKETYANAPAAKKSKATGHKKLLYDLCDKIWLSSNCYVAEAAAAAAETAQEKDDDSKSKGDYNYPELKIAVERQAGYLVFDEVVAALGKEKARCTDEQFGKLRKMEMKQWKLIHECL